MTPQEQQELTAQELTAQELTALIAWARQRDTMAKLDDNLKVLIVKKVGTLTGMQAKVLHAQRTLIPFGVTPAVFVDSRADEMRLTDKEREGLGAPDLSDRAESDMTVWALTDIITWLEAQPDGTQRYSRLLDIYRLALRRASDVYEMAYGPLIVVRAINMVMTLARARKYIVAQEKGR